MFVLISNGLGILLFELKYNVYLSDICYTVLRELIFIFFYGYLCVC